MKYIEQQEKQMSVISLLVEKNACYPIALE
jgi:hypothetical protein